MVYFDKKDRFNGTFLKISNKMAKEIECLYLNKKKGVWYIGKKFDLSPGTIQKVLIKKGIIRRTRKELGEIYRKSNFSINKLTDELAWVFGIVATDGHIENSTNKRSGGFAVSSIDMQILKHLKRICNKPKAKIGNTQHDNQKRVRICDTNLYEILLNIGIPNYRKTYHLGALKLPHKLFIPFLCGAIDGDGNKHKNNTFEITSMSKAFLLWIKEELDNHFHANTSIIYDYTKNKGGTYRLYCYNKYGRLLGKEIEKNNYILLKRKIWWK